MNTAIALKTTAGFTKATNIGKALASVVAATVGCTADDVATLNTAKAAVTAAKAVLETVSAEQQNKIKAAIETINAAIAEITAVNTILAASGKSTLADPGTTLATVTAPSLATEAAGTLGNLSQRNQFYNVFSLKLQQQHLPQEQEQPQPRQSLHTVRS